MEHTRILLVGCGNMAGAMLEGWLAAGFAPDRFTIVDPLRGAGPGGLPILRALPAAGGFDYIVLGVKPQALDEVAPGLAPLAGGQATVLSLLAGVDLASLRARFARAGALVRLMPNLAVALGKAPIALAGASYGAPDHHPRALGDAARADLAALLAPLGQIGWVEEDRFDLVTALAGSGPAFVYRFIDALSTASIRLGLAEQEARGLALAMVEGAALLAAHSPHSPGVLAEMVASKGGVTRAGLDVLDGDEALIGLMLATLRAARDRSAQMGAEARLVRGADG